jgi:hypothetical protein
MELAVCTRHCCVAVCDMLRVGAKQQCCEALLSIVISVSHNIVLMFLCAACWADHRV